MEAPIVLESIHQINQHKAEPTLHPLISVYSQEGKPPMKSRLYKSELYLIFLKKSHCAEIVYGRKTYDYQQGTLVCIGPGQEFGLEYKNITPQPPNGWSIAFHPDLLKGTSLAHKIKQFGFFSYAINEALHLSDKEQKMMVEIIGKLRAEIELPVDQHSRIIIASHLELFLNYCQRFYQRQFHSRAPENLNLDQQLNTILETYLNEPDLLKFGPPTVAYCAEKLSLSTNYFGDLVKQQLEQSAQNFIQNFLVVRAKEKLESGHKSIKEVAYELGFAYPNHFSRFFKTQTGKSPSAFKLNLN